MPATRSGAARSRSESVHLLSRYIRSTPQSPLYQPGIPIALPLPVIRATLVYAEDGEPPLVVLQRPIPRPAQEPQSLHRRGRSPRVTIHPREVTPAHGVVRSRRVSINPRDVTSARGTPLRRSLSRDTSFPPSRALSPLTDLSHESDVASVEPDEATIVKPPGEAGRPDSGGYNLEVAMNWNSSEFIRLKVVPILSVSVCIL